MCIKSAALKAANRLFYIKTKRLALNYDLKTFASNLSKHIFFKAPILAENTKYLEICGFQTLSKVPSFHVPFLNSDRYFHWITLDPDLYGENNSDQWVCVQFDNRYIQYQMKLML